MSNSSSNGTSAPGAFRTPPSIQELRDLVKGDCLRLIHILEAVSRDNESLDCVAIYLHGRMTNVANAAAQKDRNQTEMFKEFDKQTS